MSAWHGTMVAPVRPRELSRFDTARVPHRHGPGGAGGATIDAMRILILDGVADVAIEAAEAGGRHEVALGATSAADALAHADALARADALIVSRVPVDGALLDRAPRVRAVGRLGVGVDNVDLHAAAARGIAVVNAPDYCVDEVAEHAIALLLTAWRETARLDRAVRRGAWEPDGMRPVPLVAGRTLGIVGLGRIGRAVAWRARGLGLRVIAHEPQPRPDEAEELVSLGELYARADAISLHVPLVAATAGLIDEAALAAMRPGVVLVNVSRGGLVDERALLAALEAGRVFAACLDVRRLEPPAADDLLRARDDVTSTPHVAYASADAPARRRAIVIRDVIAVLEGREPVNPVALPTLAG